MRQPLSLKDHTWGAVEAVGRFSGLWVDKNAFSSFASFSTAAQRASAWAIGLNWYLNNSVKWMVDYEQTHFHGGSDRGTDRDNEQVLLTRWQVSY